jgi:hypothetical protein
VKFDSTDPLTARSRFVSRTFANCIRLAAVFLVSIIPLSWLVSGLYPGFAPMLVVDALVLGGVYYLHLLWEKRPVKIRCGQCGKIISSSTPWVCGVCGTKNTDTEHFPFMFKCKNKDCGTEPKAYRCHHQDCGAMIFLTEDEDATNYAHNVNSPAEMPPRDQHADELRSLREKKERILEEREIAIVEEELKKFEKRMADAGKSRPSATELVKQDVDYIMELEEVEAALLASYEEKYRDNKPMLKRMRTALKASVQSRKAERM